MCVQKFRDLKACATLQVPPGPGPQNWQLLITIGIPFRDTLSRTVSVIDEFFWTCFWDPFALFEGNTSSRNFVG